MKNWLSTWIICFLPLTISGCAEVQTSNAEINAKVRTIVLGKSVDNLYSMWGNPSKVESLPSGNGKIYVWRYLDCQSIATADNSGLVVDYYASGNCQMK